MNDSIPFVKATACGNDFLLIEGSLVEEKDRHSLTQTMCDRHLGIGADGVEWLFPTNEADIYARLINSDGSDAEVSGNGSRCVAAWHTWKNLAEYHRPPDDLNDLLTTIGKSAVVRVLTDAGIKSCTLVRQRGVEFEFRSDMGEPKLDRPQPLDLDPERGRAVEPLDGRDRAQADEAAGLEAEAQAGAAVRQPSERVHRVPEQHVAQARRDLAAVDQRARLEAARVHRVQVAHRVAQHAAGIEGVVGDERRGAERAEVLVAVVHDPLHGETFCALRGGGGRALIVQGARRAVRTERRLEFRRLRAGGGAPDLAGPASAPCRSSSGCWGGRTERGHRTHP